MSRGRGPDLGQRLDLVSLQRDQRGDHDGGPIREQCRDLIDRELAGAGRHHHDHVAALDDRAHHFVLAGQERVVAETFLGDGEEMCGRFCHVAVVIPRLLAPNHPTWLRSELGNVLLRARAGARK